MKKLLTLGMAAGLLLSACAAYAYPSLLGPTGTGALPTAAVAPAGQLDLAADIYDTNPDSSVPVRLVYGTGSNFEVGAGYNFVSDANIWTVDAKYATSVKLAGFNWSLGALYSNLKDTDTNDVQVYWVGDQNFTMGDKVVTGTLGVNWTRSDFGVTNADAIRVFAGIQAPLVEKLSVVGDIQSSNEEIGDTDPLYSVALRYDVMKNLQAQLGFSNSGGVFGTGDSNVFAGVNLAFNTGSAEDED